MRRRRRVEAVNALVEGTAPSLPGPCFRSSSGAVGAPRIDSLPAIERSQLGYALETPPMVNLRPVFAPAVETRGRGRRLWITVLAAVVVTAALVWLTSSL